MPTWDDLGVHVSCFRPAWEVQSRILLAGAISKLEAIENYKLFSQRWRYRGGSDLPSSRVAGPRYVIEKGEAQVATLSIRRNLLFRIFN